MIRIKHKSTGNDGIKPMIKEKKGQSLDPSPFGLFIIALDMVNNTDYSNCY